MAPARVRMDGKDSTVPREHVRTDCLVHLVLLCVSAMPRIQICVIRGQESVSAKQAGMVQYVHVHAHSTCTARAANTYVSVRMMHSALP